MEPKQYKTVASLLKAYEKGTLSKRKHKIELADEDSVVGNLYLHVQTGDCDSVFQMGVGDFIKQLAKLGGVKLPTAF